MNLPNRDTKKGGSSDAHPIDKEDFLRAKPLYRCILLTLLFILALGIRIYRLSDPPLEFNSSRQYQCALMARYYYYMAEDSASEWQRQMAKAQKPPNYEPPVIEIISSLFYQITGKESLWFPRLLSVLFWLTSGVGIYFISKKLWSEASAVFSVTLFLFLPFGIFSSRSFLPDPLMIMLMVFAFLAIIAYFEKPTYARLATSGLLSAAAIFIKPMSAFMILFAFGFLMISWKKVQESITHPHLWIFLFIALAPGATYYSYGLFITKSLQAQAGWSFIPRLIAHPLFYKGWAQNVGLAVSFSFFLVSVLALPLTYKRKTPRAFLVGLWVGYIVFCLTFNYHAMTHHYYHLPLIPLVALSGGYVGAILYGRLNSSRIAWGIRATVTTVLLIVLAMDGMKQVAVRRHWMESHMDFKRVVEVAKEIGQRVDHSMKCIFLDREYGSTLKYHGWLAGEIWYNAEDFSLRRRFYGEFEDNVEEIYMKEYAIHQPQFFLVTDFKEFEKQKDLREFLISNFPIVASTPYYLIFDTSCVRE